MKISFYKPFEKCYYLNEFSNFSFDAKVFQYVSTFSFHALYTKYYLKVVLATVRSEVRTGPI